MYAGNISEYYGVLDAFLATAELLVENWQQLFRQRRA